jgi:hypothetical protein
MGSPYFVWINANEKISSWCLLGAVCVTPPAQVKRGMAWDDALVAIELIHESPAELAAAIADPKALLDKLDTVAPTSHPEGPDDGEEEVEESEFGLQNVRDRPLLEELETQLQVPEEP